MQIRFCKYIEEFQFNLSGYLIKNHSENEKILISQSLPPESLTEIVRNLNVDDIKCKIYKYTNLEKLLKDYFSDDVVSGVIFKFSNKFYGLNIFNFDKFLQATEFYLYVFDVYNEDSKISVESVIRAIEYIKEVDISYFETYKLMNNLMVEIKSSGFRDYIVNIIDKFYYKNIIYPHFDIHFYRLKGSVDNVNYYFLFTFHPNISSSGSVCFGKNQKSILNLSRLEMNFDSAYNSGIRYTSYNINKELIKKIIEGGGLNV